MAPMMGTRETTNCELCDGPTPLMVTKRCDRCWELERRIEKDPHLAQRILNRVLRDQRP